MAAVTTPDAVTPVVTTTPLLEPPALLDLLPAVGAVSWVRRGEGLVGWGEAARLVNQAVEATFAEGEETAQRGPGGKLYVTYDIARQFPGYGEKAGAASSEFTDRIIHHLSAR